MNLSYVKSYLQDKKDNITTKDVEELIAEISAYLGTEDSFTDVSAIMRTIHDYDLTFLSLVKEYEGLKTNDIKLLPTRCEKVREILCTLSALHTYLTLTCARITESNFNMKNLRSYVTDLNTKKEHFKSEKVTWATILRSLTQEMVFAVEMRKLDIEDEMGYIKYKDN